MVQYSDTPRLEISLGKHQGGADLIQAIQSITYMGGNTQVGVTPPACSLNYFCSSINMQYVPSSLMEMHEGSGPRCFPQVPWDTSVQDGGGGGGIKQTLCPIKCPVNIFTTSRAPSKNKGLIKRSSYGEAEHT